MLSTHTDLWWFLSQAILFPFLWKAPRALVSPSRADMFHIRLKPGSLALGAQMQGINRAPLDWDASIHTSSSVHFSWHPRAGCSCQTPVSPEQWPVCSDHCGHCGKHQSVLGTVTRAFWLNRRRIRSVLKAQLATIASFEWKLFEKGMSNRHSRTLYTFVSRPLRVRNALTLGSQELNEKRTLFLMSLRCNRNS